MFFAASSVMLMIDVLDTRKHMEVTAGVLDDGEVGEMWSLQPALCTVNFFLTKLQIFFSSCTISKGFSMMSLIISRTLFIGTLEDNVANNHCTDLFSMLPVCLVLFPQ